MSHKHNMEATGRGMALGVESREQPGGLEVGRDVLEFGDKTGLSCPSVISVAWIVVSSCAHPGRN